MGFCGFFHTVPNLIPIHESCAFLVLILSGFFFLWVCPFEGTWQLMKIMGRNYFTIWSCPKTTRHKILLFCGSMGDLVARVLMVLFMSMVWISSFDSNFYRMKDWAVWYHYRLCYWIIELVGMIWCERQFSQTFMQISFQFFRFQVQFISNSGILTLSGCSFLFS